VDKMRIAALEATLKLYRDSDRLAERLPTIRLLARPKAEIAALAGRIAPALAAKLGDAYRVERVDSDSQIGSGALPLETLPSAGIGIMPTAARGQGRALAALATALRNLPVPVIGHIAEGSLVLDLRCLEDEAGFVANLAPLAIAEGQDASA
jgi:L-seryl-tRNA(Ser) seleniumtransferase